MALRHRIRAIEGSRRYPYTTPHDDMVRALQSDIAYHRHVLEQLRQLRKSKQRDARIAHHECDLIFLAREIMRHGN